MYSSLANFPQLVSFILFLFLLSSSLVMLLSAEELIAVDAITSQFAGRPFAAHVMLSNT
jgi:hypothetical protein